jgi:heme O synthase-like polyprenyltransferase
MIALRDYLSLMKIRIDVFITLSGLIGALATAQGPISMPHTAWLALAHQGDYARAGIPMLPVVAGPIF